MRGDQHPMRLALREARELVIEHLSDAFAKDQLALEEFESRVDGAYRASTEVELQAFVKDLVLDPSIAMPEPSVRTALAVPGPRSRRARAILGHVERRGRFRIPNGYRALAVMGNLELDLRDVVLPDGVTEMHVRAVIGNVEITVPPTLPVECEGTGILGAFAMLHRMPAEGAASGPVLRIVGSAVLGNVEIRTLPVGVASAGGRPRALPSKPGKPT
jgi:hypothetical protein